MVDYSAMGFRAPGTARRRLAPADTLALHQAERDWLLAKLKEPFDGATVTHHAPSVRTRHGSFENPGFNPDLVIDTETFQTQP